MEKERVLSLIPARAGSKGLPGKNKLIFAGLPLVTHAMRFSKQLSEYLDIITLVLTDDPEIQQLANQELGDVGYRREVHLSQDETSMNDTVAHAVAWCEQQKLNFDWILLLQPTTPLRTLEGVLQVLKHAQNDAHRDQHCYASVSPLKEKRYELVSQNADGRFYSLSHRDSDARRQKYSSETVCFEDGAAYLASTAFFNHYQQLVVGDRIEYVLAGSEWVTDIDDQEDFEVTELLYQSRLREKS